MKTFSFGRSKITDRGPCYVIAEIGHNHQGDLDTALKLIKVAAAMGAHAVKFQKRDNKTLFTEAMYNKPYDNENSYGLIYGEHREYLEFDMDEHIAMKECAESHDVEFFSSPFDIPSVDFLEELGVLAYKVASGDLTNIPLLSYIAKLGKPMFISTGASTMEEIRLAYEVISETNKNVCLMHCTSGYPAEYETLNLRTIVTLKEEFPNAIIGYSGHDIGILAPSIAYMLGATVIEKHFTLNRAWKGTDHKFSLEPTGMHKMTRDLHRIDISLGDGVKRIQDFEYGARQKMGKSLYAARNLSAGTVLTYDDIAVKSPGDGMPPYYLDNLIGSTLLVDMLAEHPFSADHFGSEVSEQKIANS